MENLKVTSIQRSPITPSFKGNIRKNPNARNSTPVRFGANYAEGLSKFIRDENVIKTLPAPVGNRYLLPPVRGPYGGAGALEYYLFMTNSQGVVPNTLRYCGRFMQNLKTRVTSSIAMGYKLAQEPILSTKLSASTYMKAFPLPSDIYSQIYTRHPSLRAEVMNNCFKALDNEEFPFSTTKSATLKVLGEIAENHKEAVKEIV